VARPRGIARRRAGFERLDLRRQGSGSGQAEDVLQAVGLAPPHHFRTGIVAVAAQPDPGPRKALADMTDHPLDQGQDLAAARRRRLPQHGHDQPAAGVEDMDRQKAPVIVIGVELAQFLLAPIEAFVEIQGEVAIGKLSQYRSSIAWAMR
jgi:hypothetical protein